MAGLLGVVNRDKQEIMSLGMTKFAKKFSSISVDL